MRGGSLEVKYYYLGGRKLKKTLKWIDKNLEEVLMAGSLWMIVIIMGLQIVMRYIFKQSLSWSEESARYFFIWFTFLGISFAVHNNTHIRLDIIETIVPKLKKPLEYIGDLFFIAFAAYMVKPGIDVIKFLVGTNQTSPALELPMYVVYTSLLLGILLTLIRYLQKYITIIFGKGVEK